MADYIGQTFGNYRLLRVLGKGSFADVYLGKHMYLKTEAAIKVLYGRLDAETVEAFLREAHILHSIEHPHIMRVYDASILDGVPYLVMDYAPGGTMRERHPRGVPVPLPTILAYVKQIATALDHAHENKLIHRDLKPENLLINHIGEVLLSDFGIALPMRNTDSMSVQALRGTLAYMAPEQIRGKPRGASDQYALGIMVYEWLCGYRPFSGEAAELLGQHLFVSPPSLRARMPEIPDQIEQIIFKALAKEHQQRFACVADFAAALEEASLGKEISQRFQRPSTTSPQDEGASTPRPASFAKQKRISNLPTRLTRLIGQEQTREAACVLLVRPEVRLLAMTGPGGIGKTSLALAVASDIQAAFPDGVCYVPLVTISDPDQMLPTLFQALGVNEGEVSTVMRLASALQGQRLLLVLDNFEQIIDAAPVVLDLLEHCPDLSLLITSRIVLHIPGEHAFPVPPLQHPDLKKAQETYAQVASVQLFCERAREHDTHFRLTSTNTREVAEICASLDGLPLAIELAAARMLTMAPRQLLKHLKRRLDLLVSTSKVLPERQQTIRKTIHWSYDLLQPADQVLLQRIAVFVGGCRMSDIEALYEQLKEDAFAVMDNVAHLLDCSLISRTAQEQGEARLSLLETIREFGLERLEASGESARVRTAHATYYQSLAPEGASTSYIPPDGEWSQLVQSEFENMMAALAYLYDSQQFKQAVIFAAALSCLAPISSRTHRYMDEATHALAVYEQHRHEIPVLHKAALLVGRGMAGYFMLASLAVLPSILEALTLLRPMISSSLLPVALDLLILTTFDLGDFAQTDRAIAESRVWAQATGMSSPLPRTIVCQALSEFYRGAFDQAYKTLQEALEVSLRRGEIWPEAASYHYIGWIAYQQKAYQAARKSSEKAVEMLRALHFAGIGLESLCVLATEMLALGETAQAQELFAEACSRSVEFGDDGEVARALCGLARIALQQGDHARAASLFEESITSLQRLTTITTRFQHILACSLEGMAALAMHKNQMIRAICLLGAADAQRNKGGYYDPIGLDATAHAQVEAEARFASGEQAFRQAHAAGQQMTPQQALAAWELIPTRQALATTPPLPDTVQTDQPVLISSFGAEKDMPQVEHLTRRELDVLRLLAEGQSNAEIAQNLMLSVVTVNSYLRTIYSKLKVSSRTRAIRCAMEQNLLADSLRIE